MIRRTGRNRFGHELARTPVANPQRRRWPHLQPRFTLFAPHAANRSPTAGNRRPARCAAALSVTTVWLGAQRLFAPRHARVGKTVRARSDRRRRRFATDAPVTWLSTRLFTVGRITSAAAVIVSTRADEPFFRGDEPERSPSHAVVASPRCGGEPTVRT